MKNYSTISKIGNCTYYSIKNSCHILHSILTSYYPNNNFNVFYEVLHRLDGPAIEHKFHFVRNSKVRNHNSWYFAGKHIDVSSQEEFENYLKVINESII